ncbi:MAG: ArnT family glycosyltransferase [Planctomycetota bacterium]|jgi:4-amino-4-deoxy-L-arabinose transferase-like glycosyltransferase
MRFATIGKPANTAIIPLLVIVLCYVPFLDKAFNVDEPVFIEAAKQIQSNPVDFYGFTFNWYGAEMPMSQITKNPPLTSYYIAMVALLFGWSEMVLHLAFLVPAAAVALGTYHLAKQFCSKPALAAIITVLTPGFLISSTTVMCDTMMLAFWLWAVVLWVGGIKQNKKSALLFSALLMAACALTKYFGAALLPLLFVYGTVKKRKLGTWVLFLLLPVLVLVAYQWLTQTLYGRGLLLDATAYAANLRWRGSAKLFSKALIGLAFTGGCIITVLFYAPMLWSRRHLLGGIITTVLLTIAVILIGKIGPFAVSDDAGIKWGFLIQFALMVMAGVSVLVLICADFLKSKDIDSLLLLLWGLGTFIFSAFINWTVNARSLLPMIPVVAIFLARRIDQRSASDEKSVSFFKNAWPLLPAAVVVLLLTWVDYAWANSVRTAAKNINKEFGNSQNVVWFQGHWGFQYYMQNYGHSPVDFLRFRPAAGDIIVKPSTNTNTNVRPVPESKVYLRHSFEITPCRWLATLNASVGAGFYADVWGPLPFAVGHVAPQEYHIYVVKPLQLEGK